MAWLLPGCKLQSYKRNRFQLRQIQQLSEDGFSVICTTHIPDHALMLGGQVARSYEYGTVQSRQEYITNSAMAICPGMVSDVIEYGDWKLGKRQEGLAASFLSFGVKIATAIVGSAGVLLLASVGYIPNAEQTEAARNGINFVVNIIPAIVALLSIIPLFFYKLDDKRVSEIRTDLGAGKHAWNK